MNKSTIIEELRKTQAELSDTVQGLSQSQFEQSQGETWSASGYLKHLLLSNKPFVKGLGMSKEALGKLFGESASGSRSYEGLEAAYKGRLSEGVRAENFDKVTPAFYRFPEGITDEKAYLVESWNETHEKLYAALENWDESDLDRYQMPHPAIGNITIREMLYFTILHNRLHTNDIAAVSQL